MENIPSDLKYSNSHEWVRLGEDGIATIGITDHAQALLGDIVFVEFPEVATSLKADDECGVVESVKAASDIYSPINGDIVEVNAALDAKPDLLNSDPYGDGWLLRIQPNDEADVGELMDAEEYQALVAVEK